MSEMEQIALGVLRSRHPGIERRGFGEKAREVYKAAGCDEEEDEDLFDALTDYRVDAWRHTEEGFEIFEIEDTHKLSAAKLEHYANLWFDLDTWCIGCRLFVTDRYGLEVKEIPLKDIYYVCVDRRLERA